MDPNMKVRKSFREFPLPEHQTLRKAHPKLTFPAELQLPLPLTICPTKTSFRQLYSSLLVIDYFVRITAIGVFDLNAVPANAGIHAVRQCPMTLGP